MSWQFWNKEVEYFVYSLNRFKARSDCETALPRKVKNISNFLQRNATFLMITQLPDK